MKNNLQPLILVVGASSEISIELIKILQEKNKLLIITRKEVSYIKNAKVIY
jgi:short-subunit dehydrogenase